MATSRLNSYKIPFIKHKTFKNQRVAFDNFRIHGYHIFPVLEVFTKYENVVLFLKIENMNFLLLYASNYLNNFFHCNGII